MNLLKAIRERIEKEKVLHHTRQTTRVVCVPAVNRIFIAVDRVVHLVRSGEGRTNL